MHSLQTLQPCSYDTQTKSDRKIKTDVKQEGIVHHVLQRMSVDGGDTNGGSPLVVLFVEMLVEAWMVEQPDRHKH